MSARGSSIGVGVGPGDPGAADAEGDARARRGRRGRAFRQGRQRQQCARASSRAHLRPASTELPLLYPVTTEIPRQRRRLSRRDRATSTTARPTTVAAHLDAGPHRRRDLRGRSAVLRLLHASACAARAALSDRGRRRRHRHVRLLVGGRHADRARRRRVHRAARHAAGSRAGAPARRRRRRRGDEGRPQSRQGAPRARAQPAGSTAPSMSSAAPWPTPSMMPLADKPDDERALFRRGAGARLGGTAVSGRLAVVGLGPGDAALAHAGGARRRSRPPMRSTATRPISTACRRAPDQTRHASDNREEGARAAAALRHAAEGASVAVVSGGDPGVFAMAAAVCEAIESGPRCLARARHRHRARHHRDARGRRARRRAARPRFLRAVAVRQSQAVGADRAAARRGGARRASSSRSTIRSRARGPGSSASRLRRCCAGICRRRRRSIFGRAVGRADESVTRDDARRAPTRRRRHGDADHRRLARDARDRARRAQRRWSTRRARSRGAAHDRARRAPPRPSRRPATSGSAGRAQHDHRRCRARAPPRSCRRSRRRRCSWRRRSRCDACSSSARSSASANGPRAGDVVACGTASGGSTGSTLRMR